MDQWAYTLSGGFVMVTAVVIVLIGVIDVIRNGEWK